MDPSDQLLEAYRLESGRWVRLGAWRGDVSARVEPFDAIELSLGRLWEA